jgi:hypothetical protein
MLRHPTKYRSVNFVHNISTTTACQPLMDGQEAAINAFVEKAFIQ